MNGVVVCISTLSFIEAVDEPLQVEIIFNRTPTLVCVKIFRVCTTTYFLHRVGKNLRQNLHAQQSDIDAFLACATLVNCQYLSLLSGIRFPQMGQWRVRVPRNQALLWPPVDYILPCLIVKAIAVFAVQTP